MGRVVFDTSIESLKKVLKLRCIDNVTIVIGAKTGFDFANSTEEKSLEILTDFAQELSWKKGLKAWNSIFVRFFRS